VVISREAESLQEDEVKTGSKVPMVGEEKFSERVAGRSVAV
jgi:hypothetical protein